MSEFSKPVLAFESSLGGCAGAVMGAAGETLSQFSFETDRDQAAKLMPQVQAIMEQAGVEFSALGLIVTTTGPGSFTGLRISLSAARTMGLALNIPVQGVSTLEAMARTCAKDADENLLVVLETKRADFYVQAFATGFQSLTSAACLSADEIVLLAQTQKFILCGDGTGRFLDETKALNLFHEIREAKLLNPEALAKAGITHFIKNGQKADKPEPLYLRGADVSLSNKIQRQINPVS